MRYVIDVVVDFERSWGGLRAAQICLFGAVGLVLSDIRSLILSYLILPYLGYLRYVCYLGLSWVTRGRPSPEVWGQQVS